ncbi:MAG: DNA ligase LigA-related protein [Ferrovibrio sp.]|uniref:DNA ligase LigA-related protein n=1 Tax=Ferrovibrio sp. TaxID=1917215 RepID=UPI00391DEB24
MARRRRVAPYVPQVDNHDAALEDALAKSINLAVPWYLMASYGYYIKDVSILSDAAYDRLCVLLRDRWDEITHHHKDRIDRASLNAGSGFGLREEQYPLIARDAAHSLIKQLKHGNE